MKAAQKLIQELNNREQELATDIARFAQILEVFPCERDVGQLDGARRAATTSRRKLSFFLKDNMPALDVPQSAEPSVRRQGQVIKKAFNVAQKRVRHCTQFEALMSEQVHAAPQDLIYKAASQTGGVEVMDHVVTMFLDAMHTIANPTAYTQSKSANEQGFHRDIPLPMNQFTKMIAAAYRLCLAQRKRRPLRFLDVGSGGGTKVLAATTCFPICDGLEYEENAIKAGAAMLKLLAPDACKLYHADALTFSDYHQYDVIYFYRPIAGLKNMKVLEDRVFSQARPGTVLIVAGELLSADLEAKGIQKLVNTVYVTGMSKSEAATLHELAKHMGTTVPGYGRRVQSDLGYWQPLLDASALNGFHI
ncbi:MAG: hypothetical protein ABJL99_16855 [Aliishimia sp.]